MQNSFRIKFIDCTENDLEQIGFDKTYVKKGIERHAFKTVKISSLNCAQANIIKQTAISVGCDCAVHREVITGKVELSDCILSASLNQYKKIAKKLKYQPFKLAQLGSQLQSLVFENKKPLIIRSKQITAQQIPAIMGILNITPDSFSDGGEYFETQSAVNRFFEMVNQGADIVDIGGESTRPYSKEVTVEEEIKRVITVIEEIRKKDKKTIISIDTRNSLTARAAIKSGADIINDVSGLDWDKNMAQAVKELSCPVVINHSKGSPETMQDDTNYNEVVNDIFDYLQDKIELLCELGVEKEKIIIDPGLGFGKTTAQNFEIIKRLNEFESLGCAILVGHSRKNFIKETINSEETEKLDTATVVLSQKLIEKKVDIIRVHDVEKHSMFIKLNKSLL